MTKITRQQRRYAARKIENCKRPTRIQKQIAEIEETYGQVDWRNYSRHPKGQKRTQAPKENLR